MAFLWSGCWQWEVALSLDPWEASKWKKMLRTWKKRQGRGAGDAYVRGDEETCFVDDPTGLGSWVQPGLPP